MPELRFSKFNQDPFNFLSQFASSLNQLLDFNNLLDLHFIPHMFSDMKAISYLLGELRDVHRRERVTVARYDTRANSEEFLQAYSQLNGIIGMRFHSHVFGVSRRIPLFSLNSYPQIDKLLKNYGLGSIKSYNFQEDYKLCEDGLFSFLDELVKKSAKSEHFAKFHEVIEENRKVAGAKIQKWLNSGAR